MTSGESAITPTLIQNIQMSKTAGFILFISLFYKFWVKLHPVMTQQSFSRFFKNFKRAFSVTFDVNKLSYFPWKPGQI